MVKQPPEWVSDESVQNCMICNINFTFFIRKHHCRRCGKCICFKCGPDSNTRPILEWNIKDPVRHCYLCYRYSKSLKIYMY